MERLKSVEGITYYDNSKDCWKTGYKRVDFAQQTGSLDKKPFN